MHFTRAQLLQLLDAADREHIYQSDAGPAYVRGCQMPKYPAAFATYAANLPVYSRQEILAKIAAGQGSLGDAVFAILNQGSRPWCWAYAATQCLMILLRQLYGEAVILDPSLGPALTGVMGGNAIDAMLKEVQIPYGAVPAEYLGDDPTRSVTNVRRSSWPAQWKTEAAKRQAVDGDYLQCGDLLSAASSILNKHPGVLGVNWRGGGHAVCCAEVGAEGNELYLAGPNSWGASFTSGWGSYPGRPGWWKLGESALRSAWNGYGYYALCGARNDAVPAPAPPAG